MTESLKIDFSLNNLLLVNIRDPGISTLSIIKAVDEELGPLDLTNG